MNRIQFTNAISILIRQMIDAGENPILDYVLRSTEEQQRLFAAGKSKRDGVKNPSAHQSAKAADIYFIEGVAITEGIKGHDYWHQEWVKLGGKPIISWDRGHYEIT